MIKLIKIITCNQYDVEVRPKYAKIKFRNLKSIKDSKDLAFPKTIIEENDNNIRYEKRILWLSYDIYKPRRCEICGNLACRKGLVSLSFDVNSDKKPISLFVCRSCISNRNIQDTETQNKVKAECKTCKSKNRCSYH